MIAKVRLYVEVDGAKVYRTFDVDAPKIMSVDLVDAMMHTLKSAFDYQPKVVYTEEFMRNWLGENWKDL